jgi:dipeptidase E
MKMFLTAKSFIHDNNEVFNKFLDVIETQNIGKKIITITTAQRDADGRRNFESRTREIFIHAGFSDVEFIDIEFDDPDRIRAFPIVCIGGGDPFYLLDQIKKTNADRVVKDLFNSGHFLVGHSSGAAVLGESIEIANILHPEWNHINMSDFNAMGIIQGNILPHSNRYLEEEKVIEYEKVMNKDLIKIEDGKYLIL